MLRIRITFFKVGKLDHFQCMLESVYGFRRVLNVRAWIPGGSVLQWFRNGMGPTRSLRRSSSQTMQEKEQN